MAKYKYNHPEGIGVGQHHADGDLATRDAQPPEVAASLRAALEVVSPTDEQRGQLDAFLSRSMHDLDLHDGTEVDLEDDLDENGNKVAVWTDAHGDERRTSFTPEFWAEHFNPVEVTA
jgi:hypothetical protein